MKSIRSVCYKSDSKISWKINEWNERCVTSYLRHEIEKNKNIDFQTMLGKPNPTVPEKSIFIMWWQGEQQAPAIVKVCIESVRAHARGHKVIVVSKYNIDKYIHIPDFIKNRVEAGEISFTHLSDIIRLNLLTLYGGAWIDATVFCAKDIPESIFIRPFYSIHFGKMTKDPSHGRWTTFLICAHKDNLIVKKVLECHYKYWYKHHVAADYIMFDYFINEVLVQNKEAAEMVENIPIENTNVFDLLPLMDDKNFDIKEFVEKHDTIFYKLSWKRKFVNADKIVNMLMQLTSNQIF